jgi:methanogenic corrinoid protein MtbC1
MQGTTMGTGTDRPTPAAEALRAQLDRLFAAHDADGAVDAALGALRDGLPLDAVYGDVLVPLLADVGVRWHEGRMRIWEEHLVTAAVRAVVENLRGEVAAARDRVARAHPGATPASALFACPEQEWHVLSLRMLADRFAAKGWRTHYLGADVPTEEIADAARTLDVDLVVMTAATHYERLFLRDMLDDIRRQLPDVRLLVSGPAFTNDAEGWPAEDLVDPEDVPDPYA